MGYGTDESEMIIELPVLTSTLVTLVKLAASETEYTAYGGDDQLIVDLSSILSVDSEKISV
jgi:putative effector of murein hydrolase